MYALAWQLRFANSLRQACCYGIAATKVHPIRDIFPLNISRGLARRPKNLVGESEEIATEDWQQLSVELKEEAKRIGLGPTLITSAAPSDRVGEYERWLAAGMHGSMSSMARPDRLQRRRDLNAILPGVQAVVMSTLFYWPGAQAVASSFSPHSPDSTIHDPHGSVSSYAWGEDYHVTLGAKMKQLGTWLHQRAGGKGMWYVDTGAVQERDLGERCGLGFVGKNSMLIHPQLGSGFFIGEMLTTLPLPPESPPSKGRGGCGRCTKCRIACPTGAIVQDRVVDARRCISYLTIELKGPIPEDLRPLMGNKIYGCDICQEVCPWNKFEWDGGASPLFGTPAADTSHPRLLSLLRLTDDEFQVRFANSPIRRIGRSRMARNAAVALGNSRNVTVIPILEVLADEEEDEMVKEHVQWAIKNLKTTYDDVAQAQL